MADISKRPVVHREESAAPADEVRTGTWWWVKSDNADGSDDERGDGWWLGCVVHVGSNYAKLEGVRWSTRVHLDHWSAQCVPAPDAAEFVAGKVHEHKTRMHALMAEVRELTSRLGVAPHALPEASSETQALALRSAEPLEEYRGALVLAKDKQLPKLFAEIKRQSEHMQKWMVAETLPLQAEVSRLEPVLGAVKARIFNVQLYAGLLEKVVEVRGGAPAGMHEKVRLFQRRHYMDEECLVAYEAGGMEFKNLSEFDEWLVRPENLQRLLPFTRCVVAFRVRRYDKEREFSDWRSFVRFALSGERDWDKQTSLYMRNGEQVYRLTTGIEFDEQLFPDLEMADMEVGKVWAEVFAGSVRHLYTDAQREAMLEELAAHRARKRKKGEHEWIPHHLSCAERLERWSPESVYHDDIAAHVKQQVDAHNRLVLVLQGLLDRSPVFMPHPPTWQLWTPDGFAAAVELVYDQSRALVAGEAPDFEAYRARLNASLRKGSVTVGQQDAWMEHEAAIHNRTRSWRDRNHYDVKRYKPYGDPGPGMLARVARVSPQGCTYEWTRGRRDLSRRWRPDTPLPRRFRCPASRVLNVDAYTSGDFKQFYADPRTRADYLQWAPLMLEAEEWHAGNRKLGGDK